MILEQFRSREEAAAHSLRTGHAMIWEPGMEDEPPVVPPRDQPGYRATKTLMKNRIQGVVTKLSGFSGSPSDDVIRAAVLDALDEVVPAGGGARLSEQSERLVTEMFGERDPELVTRLQPFLDKMMQNPGAYAIALEEFEDGSAYDPMGASMNSTLQMIKMLAKKAGDMEMIQMVGNAVLPDGRTFLQSAQEEDAAAMAGIAAADDPTGHATPFAAGPADPTAMDDPFATMPTRELSQDTPIGGLSESRRHLQEMISPEAFNLLFKLTREFLTQAKASGASEEQIQGVVDAAIEQPELIDHPDLHRGPLPPNPVTPDPDNPGLDPKKQNRPAFGTLQRGWLDYLKEDDRAESLNESKKTFARWNLIAGIPQKKTK